jgi:hypothetical protein
VSFNVIIGIAPECRNSQKQYKGTSISPCQG